MQPSLSMPAQDVPAAITAEEFAVLMENLPLVNAPMTAMAVAVSGGPDSMALAWLLSRWAGGQGIALHALIVDHGMRPESAEEAERVRAQLSSWRGITRAAVLTRSTKAAAQPARLMERARTDRYALLTEDAARHNIDLIAVAHHRDDQAETFLFRLAKGTGLDGLAAMKRLQKLEGGATLFRPLLAIAKDRLIATCETNCIEYIRDPSNTNPTFARPRLRNANKALEEEGLTADRLATTAHRIGRAREALEVFTDRIFDSSLKSKETNRIVFSLSALNAEPEDIRLRVLQKALALFDPEPGYGPRLERIEALAARLFSPEGCPGATLAGVVCRSLPGRDELILDRE